MAEINIVGTIGIMPTKKDSIAIVDFHRSALKIILNFILDQGITTVSELNAVNGKKLLEEPLWKIEEAYEKYGGEFISEGVKGIEGALGHSVDSQGKWPENKLTSWLGKATDGSQWRNNPSYCCHLEHVNERKNIVLLILSKPEILDEIINDISTVCVVLRSEHRRLKSMEIDLANPWVRYQSAGIKVWSRKQNSWVA